MRRALGINGVREPRTQIISLIWAGRTQFIRSALHTECMYEVRGRMPYGTNKIMALDLTKLALGLPKERQKMRPT